MNQLDELAARKGLTLLQAFDLAEVPNSTYYRARRPGSDLRRETAEKISTALETLPDAATPEAESSTITSSRSSQRSAHAA